MVINLGSMCPLQTQKKKKNSAFVVLSVMSYAMTSSWDRAATDENHFPFTRRRLLSGVVPLKECPNFRTVVFLSEPVSSSQTILSIENHVISAMKCALKSLHLWEATCLIFFAGVAMSFQNSANCTFRNTCTSC